ncbi:MAG: response regulator [Thermoanaerobaculaceae bacterium]
MGGKILVADDSVTIQKVVELTFAETGYQVVTLGSGTELLTRLAEEKPDLVLCDVVMPDISGYEVCQQIKSNPATLHIPVVLLTGTFEPFDRDRAVAAGCDAIVTKPFEARALIATVDELLAKGLPAAPPPSETELMELGVPEGVPALDFTTTGFDRMVPPLDQPPPPPEHGLELTASSMQSGISAPPPPPPPELRPEVGAPFGPSEPFPGEPFPEVAGEPFPQAGEEVLAVEEEAQPRLPEAAPALVGEASVPPGTLSPVSEPSMGAVTAGFDATVPPKEEVETLSPGAFPSPTAAVSPVPQAVAGPPLGPTDMDGLVERVVEEVLRRLPALTSPAPASPELTKENLEDLAHRVLELAKPILERVAWEVIPDMAEMLVRQRIAELEAAAEES